MFSLCCHTVSSSWYACLCFLIEYAAEIMSQLYADRAFCCAFNFRTTGIWCLFMYEKALFIYSTFHVCWLECLHTLSDRLNAITAFRVWKLWMLVTIWQVVSVSPFFVYTRYRKVRLNALCTCCHKQSIWAECEWNIWSPLLSISVPPAPLPPSPNPPYFAMPTHHFTPSHLWMPVFGPLISDFRSAHMIWPQHCLPACWILLNFINKLLQLVDISYQHCIEYHSRSGFNTLVIWFMGKRRNPNRIVLWCHSIL